MNPGASERCDGIDDDCDGMIDPWTSADSRPWYLDGDGDGVGELSSHVNACSPPPGYAAVAGDCDVSDPTNSSVCEGLIIVPRTLAITYYLYGNSYPHHWTAALDPDGTWVGADSYFGDMGTWAWDPDAYRFTLLFDFDPSIYVVVGDLDGPVDLSVSGTYIRLFLTAFWNDSRHEYAGELG